MIVHGNYMTWGCGSISALQIHSVSEERLVGYHLPLSSVLKIAQDVTVQGFNRNLYLSMYVEILVAFR